MPMDNSGYSKFFKKLKRGDYSKDKEAKSYNEMVDSEYSKEDIEAELRRRNREKDPTANAFASGGLAGKAYRNIIEDCKKKKNKK